VRAGDVPRARQALAAAGGADGAETIEGWLALYAGDLATARTLFRATADASPALVDALALLSRTAVDSSAAAGAAHLALARGDTAAAAAAFAAAAPTVPGATPLMLAAAARLHAAVGQTSQAVALWTTLVREHAASPEAPEADLEWARALRRAGQTAAAAERLEHLILTYPESALVAQARRERDRIVNDRKPTR
jgi:tetratricopeptide (TPR) repeat protein